MAYEAMGYEVRDSVAWITFNRPDALNAINAQATREFYQIVNRVSGDRSVRAVVLTGSGDRAFCAGGDVAEFAEQGDNVDSLVREMTGELHVGISRLAWLHAPVIAAVNGVAAGAGLSFAACCDLADDPVQQQALNEGLFLPRKQVPTLYKILPYPARNGCGENPFPHLLVLLFLQ